MSILFRKYVLEETGCTDYASKKLLKLTLPGLKARGFFLHPSDLLACPEEAASRGQMSRSILHPGEIFTLPLNSELSMRLIPYHPKQGRVIHPRALKLGMNGPFM